MEILEFSWLPALAGGIMIRYRIGTVDGLQWTRFRHLRHPWRASFKMEPGSMVEADFSPRIGSRRRRSLLLGT